MSRLLATALVIWLVAPTRAMAQVSPVEDQFLISTAVQDALAWTGRYDGLADGVIGEKSLAAIVAFQHAQGWPATGDLDSTQKLRLFEIADEARRQLRFQLVTDSRSMMSIGLPTRLLPNRKDTPHGSIFTSADGQIEVLLARFRPDEGGLPELYNIIVTSPWMTAFNMKRLRRDALFVSGFNEQRDYYHSARLFGKEVRGFSISYPRDRAAQFGPIIVAMGNSFKAPMIDYTVVAAMIEPRQAPAVAAYAKRDNGQTPPTPTPSRFIERSVLIPIVSALMADAGITDYKILPPAKGNETAVVWAFEDGRFGELVALRPGSEMRPNELANAAIRRETGACKEGSKFGVARQQPRFFQGSEVQKVEAVCQSTSGATTTTYSIIALPTGAILRFGDKGAVATAPPSSNDDRGVRIENAGISYAGTNRDAFK